MKPLTLDRRKLLGRALALGALTPLAGCDFDNLRHPDLADEFLRLMSGWNNEVQAALFDPNTLAPTFKPSQITRPPRFNAFYGIDRAPQVDPATWRLNLTGRIGNKQPSAAGAAAGDDAGKPDHPADLRRGLARRRTMGRCAAR
jgi:hypothetical protein